jgi:hypothetical protein
VKGSPRAEAGGAGFSAAVTLIFGLFCWLQFPALCGFMFSSTRAGADNYRYSLYLGGLLAMVGFLSGLTTLIRGPRGAMLIAGAVLNLSFIGAAVVVPDWFEVSCHALYTDVSDE